ncbi:HAD family hydrolase [Streptomyces sp. SP18CS02]|uniref:HAD family hydrolase n=1 Tax=Streptomyces sp. SP18CS02 TaxID=3002531 RepID=UPI002E765DF7|nr:HAD family hydrolase [Streptomyces sp. SP18CS02]MEE1755582.1 HAD hydrolase-like protein [Streptomyces sp. SP18CS02]
MTSDATRIAGAGHVVLGFDGPLCRLFAGRPADQVAGHLITWLEHNDGRVRLPDRVLHGGDPYAVLAEVGRLRPDSGLVAALEEELTAEELRATPTAWPTPYADPLIRTWHATGVTLALIGDNSPRAARTYLAQRGTEYCFGSRIHGRTRASDRLRPDPDCLHRALDSLGAEAATTLMIGDSAADVTAARAAGVAFIGYGRTEERVERLRRAGAASVVMSLGPVLDAVRGR